jgi:chemotaxis protein CheX
MNSIMNPTIHSASRVRFDVNWRPIMEHAAAEVFELMAGVRLELVPPPFGEPQGEQTAMVGIAGVLCGMTTVRCSRSTATKLASAMLGRDATSDPSLSRDALGELCNMIAGNFKAKVNSLVNGCMLSVPTVISGQNYSIEAVPPTEVLTVALSFEGELVWVSLITHS